MREAKTNDFFVELEGVGTFRYGRRTFGDEAQIRVTYLRITREFGDIDATLSMYAGIIAAHSVLCVEAPKGWEDIAELDMSGPEGAERKDKVLRLFELLGDKEATLHKDAEKSGEENRQGA